MAGYYWLVEGALPGVTEHGEYIREGGTFQPPGSYDVSRLTARFAITSGPQGGRIQIGDVAGQNGVPYLDQMTDDQLLSCGWDYIAPGTVAEGEQVFPNIGPTVVIGYRADRAAQGYLGAVLRHKGADSVAAVSILPVWVQPQSVNAYRINSRVYVDPTTLGANADRAGIWRTVIDNNVNTPGTLNAGWLPWSDDDERSRLWWGPDANGAYPLGSFTEWGDPNFGGLIREWESKVAGNVWEPGANGVGENIWQRSGPDPE